MAGNEAYIQQLSKMERPIPGNSLTNDPSNPMPFEGPPEFTKKKDALENIFENMIREDIYPGLMKSLMEGGTIMELTQVILFEGFRQGKWNPDLFLILVEPTAYMLMALAERAGIDFEVDNEPPDEDEDSVLEEKFNRLAKKVGKAPNKPGMIPNEIAKQIESLPVESLMAKPTAKAETGLMQRPTPIPEEV